MEKKYKFTTGEIIKWGSLLVLIISSYLALQYKSENNADEIRQLKEKNILIESQLKEQAALTAELKGKLTKIDENVQIIVTAITNNQLNPRR